MMLITTLKSKLHRVTVTQTDLNYEGSCAIGVELMEAANIQPHEQIHIYNINTGDRFTTYAIPGEHGMISIRGSAARLAQPGDIVIICTYGLISQGGECEPIVVYVDGHNRLLD